MTTSKAALRRRFREARKALSPAQRAGKNSRIAAAAQALPFWARAAGVHAYLSMPEEVETRSLIAAAFSRGKRVAVPWIDPRDKRMLACALPSLDEPMRRDSLGIETPAHCRAIPPEDMDLVLAPGLAFDREGGRLGFGKGYYDAFLKETRAVRVGLAFGEQISGEPLPMGPKDAYMDFVLTEDALHSRGNPPEMFLLPAEQRVLLSLARLAVEANLEGRPFAPPETPPGNPLSMKAGAFVSLHAGQELRGCIGFMEGRRPLCETVCEGAVLAATQDPRFAPLDAEELAEIRMEISVLSPLRSARPEEVRVGRHGIVLSGGGMRGLLLPQVAVEHGMGREEFLDAVCGKAGLPGGSWRGPGARLEIFTAQVFGEK